MRYKFRGKNSDGKWLYGYLTKNMRGQVFIHRIELLKDGKSNIQVMEDVIPETVGMSTGMYDNTKWEDLTMQEQNAWLDLGNKFLDWRGKEVYEGDIIPYNLEPAIRGVVTFGEYAMQGDTWSNHIGFYLSFNDKDATEYSRRDLGYWLKVSKVVSNIHDDKHYNCGTDVI